jgi:hypothetical protein
LKERCRWERERERERSVEGEMQMRGREPERDTERGTEQKRLKRERRNKERELEKREKTLWSMNPVTVDAEGTRTRSSGRSTPAKQKVISGHLKWFPATRKKTTPLMISYGFLRNS